MRFPRFRGARLSLVYQRAPDDGGAEGKRHKTLVHIKAAANIVFDVLWREEIITRKLPIPELLRPFLHRWWTLAHHPHEGLVFPRLLGDEAGVEAKTGVSHAKALRRDLKRAFEWALTEDFTGAPKLHSHRWLELFEQTEYTKSVDFHSWRRAFNQALADSA